MKNQKGSNRLDRVNEELRKEIAEVLCLHIFAVNDNGKVKYFTPSKFGKEYTKETEDSIIEALSSDYIEGLSLLGGEPFEPQNQPTLVALLKRVKNELPNKNVWCYSGYTFEELSGQKESRAFTENTLEMLSMIDVLVDGEFVEELKDISLKFRGSSNQRIIDVKQSLKENKIIEKGL